MSWHAFKLNEFKSFIYSGQTKKQFLIIDIDREFTFSPPTPMLLKIKPRLINIMASFIFISWLHPNRDGGIAE